MQGGLVGLLRPLIDREERLRRGHAGGRQAAARRSERVVVPQAQDVAQLVRAGVGRLVEDGGAQTVRRGRQAGERLEQAAVAALDQELPEVGVDAGVVGPVQVAEVDVLGQAEADVDEEAAARGRGQHHARTGGGIGVVVEEQGGERALGRLLGGELHVEGGIVGLEALLDRRPLLGRVDVVVEGAEHAEGTVTIVDQHVEGGLAAVEIQEHGLGAAASPARPARPVVVIVVVVVAHGGRASGHAVAADQLLPVVPAVLIAQLAPVRTARAMAMADAADLTQLERDAAGMGRRGRPGDKRGRQQRATENDCTETAEPPPLERVLKHDCLPVHIPPGRAAARRLATTMICKFSAHNPKIGGCAGFRPADLLE